MTHRYMDNYGSEDMATPEVKLIQNVGGEVAKSAGANPGDFFVNLICEVIPGDKGFDIVIADIIKTRTYWGRSDIDTEPPECSSSDALSMISIFNENCAECEKRVEMPGLIDDPIERRKKCTPGYSILAIRADQSRMPILIRAHGINATSARELITALKINRQIKGAYEKVLIRMTSEKRKTASGEAFSMTFKPKAVLTDEKAREFLAQTEQMLGHESTLLAEVSVVAPVIEIAAEPPEQELPKKKPVAKSEKLPTTDLDF